MNTNICFFHGPPYHHQILPITPPSVLSTPTSPDNRVHTMSSNSTIPTESGPTWTRTIEISIKRKRSTAYKLMLKYSSRDPEHPFVFGRVLFMGTWISMMISTVNGAGTPILVRWL